MSDGSVKRADEKIDGGPSVLFDAVALVFSEQAGDDLATNKPAKDFVSDAHAHAKYIAWTNAATPLFEAVGIAGKIDDGMLKIDSSTVSDFLRACGNLRFWERKAT